MHVHYYYLHPITTITATTTTTTTTITSITTTTTPQLDPFQSSTYPPPDCFPPPTSHSRILPHRIPHRRPPCRTKHRKRPNPRSNHNNRTPLFWKKTMNSRTFPLKVRSLYTTTPTTSTRSNEQASKLASYSASGTQAQHTKTHKDEEDKELTTPDWDQEEAEKPSGSAANGNNEHLWEESWDDDDAAEDFSNQLKCVSLSLSSIIIRIHI